MRTSLTQRIKVSEYNLAKYKTVLAAFPGAETNSKGEYFSKLVNLNYSDLEWISGWKNHSLHVTPFCELDFANDDKIEKIKIYSSPRRNRLAYVSYPPFVYNRNPGVKQAPRIPVIKFSRLAFNMKNNNFRPDLLDDCKIQIMKFISANPGIKIDTKHLDDRLKKLISFI